MRPLIAIAFAALLTAACAGPTPYQAATEKYGYEDSRLEDNRYRVSFYGNSFTARETVEDYLLYRAAEVTLARGGDYFRVAERDTEVSTSYRTTAFPTSHFLYGSRFWYRSLAFTTYAGSGDSRPINRYKAFADILVLKGDKPVDDAQAYDARQIIENLEPSVLRPKPDKAA